MERSVENLWERNLLRLAHEAHDQVVLPFRPALWAQEHVLKKSYQMCTRIASQHSRSFYLASALLPAEKRRAIRALYAFCRLADNIVDGNDDQRLERIGHYKSRTITHVPGENGLLLAWADTRARYGIPTRYAEQLLEGVEKDLHGVHYETFEDLTVYCYGVASTVGLMSMHIIGYTSRSAIPYAVKLGVALQMTNILRDVGEDWRSGRLYLPRDELARFGVTEDDIAAGRVDERWRSFMRFQIKRNRLLYAEAIPGIRLLHPDGQPAVAAAAAFYEGILGDIEANDYDVFNRRAYLSTLEKLKKLPAIYLTARNGK
jgi:15-cis-phytoene synthase